MQIPLLAGGPVTLGGPTWATPVHWLGVNVDGATSRAPEPSRRIRFFVMTSCSVYVRLYVDGGAGRRGIDRRLYGLAGADGPLGGAVRFGRQRRRQGQRGKGHRAERKGRCSMQSHL